ncbi:MAG: TetR/AcrR family transcriptional regulator [Erythrobacter sp.]
MSRPAELSPRAARTRGALIAAGLDLMVERPIDAIPIDDFVARAGVAKGSFFNHFADKQDFAIAVAAEVRMEVEAQVTRANAGIADPVARIAGGMREGAQFALDLPRRAIVLLRSQASATASAHPLNEGLRLDIDAACDQGLLRAEARDSGVLYWLGLCQILMIHLVEFRPGYAEASKQLSDMLVLGLSGLGVPEATAHAIAGNTRLAPAPARAEKGRNHA